MPPTKKARAKREAAAQKAAAAQSTPATPVVAKSAILSTPAPPDNFDALTNNAFASAPTMTHTPLTATAKPITFPPPVGLGSGGGGGDAGTGSSKQLGTRGLKRCDWHPAYDMRCITNKDIVGFTVGGFVATCIGVGCIYACCKKSRK
jgi:hypothetical protein